ncbi:MAG: xylan 1,4-beta-xylosidase [Oscillospiraceae bacterium]|nr:xylan 1,4-beta-xylosidase [Oscillospiraceae bacterium]
MENYEHKLIQVGDTNIWYDPVTGINYMKIDGCGNSMSPMVDRTGQPVIDRHENDK